jgi:hypothetical protein
MDINKDNTWLRLMPESRTEHNFLRWAVARRLEEAATGRIELSHRHARTLIKYLRITSENVIGGPGFAVKPEDLPAFRDSLIDFDTTSQYPLTDTGIATGLLQTINIEIEVNQAGTVPDTIPDNFV